MNPDECAVVFMGSPAFAVPTLQALVATGYRIVGVYAQPDRPAGRGKRLSEPPVKQEAAHLGLPVFQPPSLRRPAALDELRGLRPDLIVVAAFGQILRPDVIDLPAYGCLNVHASLLPRHRGAAPVAAAILAGDRETGISIMQIDPGLDTGPVIAERATSIADTDTAGSLIERLSRLGAELLVDVLPAWLSGELAAVPQEASLATVAPMLQKDVGTIDWTRPAVQLWREVRAYNPWPLSVTMLNGETLQILEAVPATRPNGAPAGAPGTVLSLSGIEPDRGMDRRAGFAVQTGEGLLVPLKVRRAGRNAVSAAEFVRGVRGLIGAHLG